ERVLASHPRVLCEVRLDYLDFNPAAAFSFLARLPAEMAPRLVLTQRLKASGGIASGHCNWDVITWQSWWKDVMALRPWFAVDLDWLVLDRLAGESLAWRGRFRSRHAFFSLHASLPEAEQLLPNLISSARDHGAGVKLACPVENAEELARLAKLSSQLDTSGVHTVVAMGAAGKAWRWSPLAGTITYFAADAGRATAPGQEEMAAVLPYLSTKHRPELYLLLGDNPENRYGEGHWNRAFLRRGARARYVNCATRDAPGVPWRENITEWMAAAGVRGASVTKPYKLCFPPNPVNTLKRSGAEWEFANTDGAAICALLSRNGILPGENVVIAGGGGAARAGLEGLEAAGYEATLWVRDGGRLGRKPEGVALVSTWPGEYQEPLVEALAVYGGGQTRLVVDAQFSRSPAESPLARWAAAAGIPYVSGVAWWREQARLQDQIWFGPDRLGNAREAVLGMVPASKSETLRALAIAAAFGLPTEIHGPALNEDTEVFVRALESLGVSVDRDGSLWRVFPASSGLRPPAEAIHMGEGATGLRILGALSTVMTGTLTLTGADRLGERPQGDLIAALKAHGSQWPLKIECGGELPAAISLERSSQFATGFLIAGAAEIHAGRRDRYELRLEGEARSFSYLRLTLQLLQEAGIASELSERSVTLRLAEKKKRLQFRIEKDASSLAFLEVYGRRWGLASFFEGSSRQGDSEFPALLNRLLGGESAISLKNHPDLAPPLWAAAALFRRSLEVLECPQLHHKESDRARLLVEAAKALGAEGESTPDGFRVDFSRRRSVGAEIFLRTEGDHRIAMAAGLLAADDPLIGPDRRDCVRKSFPAFWQALAALEEAQPG
ncbi:MAG: type I 3-dehydroquinate dehydratase, partial [Bdellovibrionota bacterium]